MNMASFCSVFAIAVALLNAFAQGQFPVSPCGSPPPTSGGFACGFSQSGDTYTYDYTCGNDCSDKIGSLTCSGGPNWDSSVPACPTANGKPSPCPPNNPESEPFSVTFGKDRCRQGASDVLCMGDASGAKLLPTSVTQVLQASNCWRQNTDPPAQNMPNLQWDDELAAMAERWAAQCKPYSGNPAQDHTPQNMMFVPEDKGQGPSFQYVGQNMAWGPADYTWPQAIDAWASERNDWQYGTGQLSDKAVGHWTQLIWADSLYVGCARALCSGMNPPMVLVCNYGPGGNIGNSPQEIYGKPYVAASRRKRTYGKRKRIFARREM